MPQLRFTPNLKRFFPGLEGMEVKTCSIPEMIETAEEKYPGLKYYILDEQGHLRKHVQVFIGEDLISDRIGLSDKVEDSDEVYIMQALSGG